MSFPVLLNRGIVAELIYGPGAHHQVGVPDLLYDEVADCLAHVDELVWKAENEILLLWV